jgi:hypothetical protein
VSCVPCALRRTRDLDSVRGWICRGTGRVSALTSMLRSLNSPLRAAAGRIHSQYPARHTIPLLPTRSLFNLFKKAPSKPEFTPVLSQDNLFHPFSVSPFPAVVARGEAIKSLAPCPVCVSHHDHVHDHTKAQARAIAFECPDCGWPTHCTEEHWRADKDHAKYCSRLREVNEDEHDLRSGRRLREFELPGAFALRLRTSSNTFVPQVQVHRIRKLPYLFRTGTCSGIHVTSRRWIQNGHGDTLANCSHIP